MSEEKEKLDKFWNVKIWPWGITKWEYVVGFFIMGILSVIFLVFWFIYMIGRML